MNDPHPPVSSSGAPGAAPDHSAPIPGALKERPQWVCWRSLTRDGHPTKVPIDPKSGRAASATDPAAWSSFDEAARAAREHDHAGVGFVFTEDDPFAGVDLDGCLDEDGRLVPGAQALVDGLSSYTEISPSGRGVKVFLEATKPAWARCKSSAIAGFRETEVYDRARFFTVTGRRLAGSPFGVEPRQAELEALCARLWPERETAPAAPKSPRAAAGGFPGDDAALLEKIRSSHGGERFFRLFGGDLSEFGGDRSRADLSVCNALAFWTGRDPARMDRIFRGSALMREKWDEKRGATTYGRMTIEQAAASCRSAYGEPAPEGEPGLGALDPATGRIVLSASKTLPTARAYLDRFASHPEGRTLVSHAGELLEWSDNAYRPVEDGAIRKRLLEWLHGALQLCVTKKGGVILRGFSANPATVGHALETIRAEVHLPQSVEAPAWLGAPPGEFDAADVLPCRTMSLHVPTGAALEPTPALFTTSALDYDYDPVAPEPERWLRFLDQLFGEDRAAAELLREWFGYCLTADTSRQKMLLIVGPRRSGKGTIGRVLRGLVGASNVAGPTAGSLAQPFGLQGLLGKSVAIVSDARFGGEKSSTVVERLLCVSGEDALTVDRKYLEPVTVKLGARFVFLSNELPRLADASSALAGRFLVLRLTESFYGREDPGLAAALLEERAGILRWALEGQRRLRARGRFVQPASAADAVEDLEELGSPVSAFVKERCAVGEGRRAGIDALYKAWRAWNESDGAAAIGSKQTFCRDLKAALPHLTRRRDTGQRGFYEGIELKGVIR